MEFKTPSKEEIKTKYGITDNDFSILVSNKVPDAKELQEEESLLEKVADFFGVPTFLKKHRRTGIILAIMFLPGWLPPVYENTKNMIATTYTFYEKQITYLSNAIDNDSVYLVYYQNSNELPNNKVDFHDLPLYSGVTGISASDVPRFPIG